MVAQDQSMLVPDPWQTHSDQGPFLPEAVRGWGPSGKGFIFVDDRGRESSVSFAELSERADQIGLSLIEKGLTKGDKVGLVLVDNLEFVVSFLGAMSVGVVPVPMYPPLSFGRIDAYLDTAARILNASKSKALIVDARLRPILWKLLSRVETVDDIVTAADLMRRSGPGRPDLDLLEPDDVAFLQFTSGSTALPKGVEVTHRTLLANLNGIMKYGLQMTDRDVAVSWLPLYHDMGLIGFTLAPLWWGTPTIQMGPATFVRHPKRWMEAVSKHGGTITFAPNFAFALAARRTSAEDVKKLDLSSLKALGCGAEPNHPATLRHFMEHFAPAGLKPEALLPCYGMAEATLAMSFCGMEEPLRTDVIVAESYHADSVAKPSIEPKLQSTEFVSCGRAFPGHELFAVDDNGHRLADRQVGELVFVGPSVTRGYFENEEATQVAFADGRLRTGDLGYVVNGEVFVTGRKKDVVILNGRNYDPQTVEWSVAEVPAIRRGNVVVFSHGGEASELLVVVAETRVTEEAELKALKAEVVSKVREDLGLSIGELVLLAPGQLPKTSSGKLQRQKVKQQFEAGQVGHEGVRTIGATQGKLGMVKHVSGGVVAKVRHSVRRRAKKLKGLVNDESGVSSTPPAP